LFRSAKLKDSDDTTHLLTRHRRPGGEKLIEAARLEIWEHVTFWDDVYSTVLAGAQLAAAEQVMTGSG
jgi:hypothetical protein